MYKNQGTHKVIAFKSAKGRTGLKPTVELIKAFGISERDPDLMDWVWLTKSQEEELHTLIGRPLINDLDQGWRICISLPRKFVIRVFSN